MIPAEHPCFSAQAHFRYGRIHLPVAPRCNIRCGYCDRRYDCANESRPGVTSEVISPEAALDRVERALRLDREKSCSEVERRPIVWRIP